MAERVCTQTCEKELSFIKEHILDKGYSFDYNLCCCCCPALKECAELGKCDCSYARTGIYNADTCIECSDCKEVE